MIYGTDFSANLSEVLVEYLIKRAEKNPFLLAKIRIILPTRRSCLALKEAFLKLKKDTLLPQMIPLYDITDLDNNLPPTIPHWERLFLLTKLCQKKPNLHEITKAFQVAESLSQLLDLTYQYNVNLSKINELIPSESFAKHWQETLQFLDIIQNAWPQILKERGQIDEQDQLQQLIYSYSKKVKSDTPIIIAGLTGDLPAVAHLMKAVIKNGGDIFLDGVDQTFLKNTKECFCEHPQFLIFKTIQELGISPKEIKMISGKVSHENFVEQAFRENHWKNSGILAKDIQNISYIQCDTAEIEALTIALQLRKVLETPDKSACLITPDRTLARRVISQMRRWNINLDDSAGIPLKHTPTGSFLLLIAQLAKNPLNDQNKLALYKHPLFSDGKNTGLFHIQVKNAEKKARQEDTKLTLSLSANEKDFFELIQTPQMLPLKTILEKHIQLAESYAKTDKESGYERLWENNYGTEIYTLLNEIVNYADILDEMDSSEYPSFFQTLIGQTAGHPLYDTHPNLKILGPIEGRFYHTDVCILGGLNEQTFPPVSDTNPWLNRMMQQKIGLPDNTRKITIMTHDFMHACTSPEVILTRAIKVNGTPTVPSRFIERLQVLAQVNNISLKTYQAKLAQFTDTPNKKNEIVRPAPCPPVSIRPNELSVSNIETLRRNPYAIYAKYILHLYPLNDLGNPKKNIIYGNVVHNILSDFLKKNPDNLDPDLLVTSFKEQIKGTVLGLADQLFYTSQFEQIIPFFLSEQQNALGSRVNSFTEIKGSILLATNRPFKLTARADRIDIAPNIPAVIIDYKTGSPPSFKEVSCGNSPQLSLEALILSKGGFENISAQKVGDLQYWHLGRNPKKYSFIKGKNAPDNFDDFIKKTEYGVTELIKTFEKPTTCYEVCPISSIKPKFNDYEHLARAQEWGHVDDEGETDGSE